LSFPERYGAIGEGFIEAHHLKPISTLEEGVTVHYDIVADFAVLCCNRHRMIHRTADPSNLAQFRDMVQSNKVVKWQSVGRAALSDSQNDGLWNAEGEQSRKSLLRLRRTQLAVRTLQMTPGARRCRPTGRIPRHPEALRRAPEQSESWR